MFSQHLSLALALLGIGAAVKATPLPRSMGAYTQDITIHSSCNVSETRMLQAALSDAFEIATFAQEYIITNGPQDPVFQTYFGNQSDAYSRVLGVWESLLTSNKEGVLLRCDDIDGNCHQAGWRGHWRGENASSETVICDASYTDRKYNEAFCMYGYELVNTAPSYYWGIDLIHRLFHVPQVTNSAVEHYADDYESVIELAEHNSTYSPVDSDALQWFAAHVYAIEVAQGGQQCIGTFTDPHDHTSSSPTATASTSVSSGMSTTSTSSAAAECHTHSDGVVHCS